MSQKAINEHQLYINFKHYGTFGTKIEKLLYSKIYA